MKQLSATWHSSSTPKVTARGAGIIAIGASLAMVIAGCSSTGSSDNGGSPGTGGGTATTKTVTVPVLLPLTGAQAAVGAGTKKSLEGLAEQINKRGLLKNGTIQLNFLDNQSSPSVAVTAASPFLGKAQFLINGSVSNTEIPVNALVQPDSKGPVVYNVSPAIYPDPGSFIFAGTAPTDDVASVSAHYAKRQNWTRVAVITSTDPSGQDGRKAALAAVKKVPGMQVVADEQFGTTDTSVSSQIAHIAAAKPDVIVLWSTGAQIGTVFQGMKTAGLSDVPTIMSYGNINFDLMEKLKDVLPKTLLSQGASYFFTNLKFPAAQKSQIDLLYASMNAKPGQVDASPSYVDDGLLVYINALNHVGLDATSAQIRDYLESLTNWSGIDGIYSFSKEDHRGITGDSYGIVQYDHATGFFSPAPGSALGPIESRK